jgi:hypothetical protein
MRRPVFKSQSWIVLSLCVEASVFPSGLKATDWTEQPCLSLIRSSGSPVFCAQTVTDRNNTIEIISGCIGIKAILIALFIATPWGKVFAFIDHALYTRHTKIWMKRYGTGAPFRTLHILAPRSYRSV